ncbi:hypothetical protein SAMN05518672_1011154 [Chitinophaga sp. CF118]|uniref:hypothetical protein n=1 Tax=Chitinophaga sp. CF118 TaxID=1884367 RepID=UPI0008EDE2AE|nr:hypothetical protein [Chitinophaga sp. CF118]SFD22982.1 hypothetical protein SAMN05518672_1011154 [Chitinophaga sp. CF118]
MLELLQIKERLEEKMYTDVSSLFELRLLLMYTASFLAKKHISNFKHKKDERTSAMLLKAFSNIRSYYYILETTRQEHEQCFSEVKELVITDISNLLSSPFIQDYRMIPLQNTSLALFRMAK